MKASTENNDTYIESFIDRDIPIHKSARSVEAKWRKLDIVKWNRIGSRGRRVPVFPVALAGIAACLWLSASGQAGEKRPVVLKNAKIFTMGKAGVLENGMIVIRGARIEKIGPRLDIPPDAVVMDLAGRTVIPGLVGTASSLFLADRDRTIREEDLSFDADVLNGLDADDGAAGEVLRQGVTTVYLSSPAFRAIGGLGAVVKIKGKAGRPAEDVLRSSAGIEIKLDVQEDRKTSNLMRLIQYHKIRDAFVSAAEYAKTWDRYGKELAGYGTAIKDAKKNMGVQKPVKPERNEAYEVLLRAMKGEIPVRIEAHRADSILQAVRLAREFGLELVLLRAEEWPAVLLPEGSAISLLTHPWSDFRKSLMPGGKDGYRAEIMMTGQGDVFHSGFDMRLCEQGSPSKRDWKALSASRGLFALMPPDPFPCSARILRLSAALLVADGLSVEEALRTITVNAAKILGVFDRVGNLEEGKDADLVILDGEPLNTLSRIRTVMTDGLVVWDEKQ